MASNDGAAAFRQTIQKRLAKSDALLARMGATQSEYARVLLNALTTSLHNARPGRPSLADCTPESLDLALIKCINAGLMPDGEEAVIVPLKSGNVVKAEVWPGYVGMLKNAKEATPGLRVSLRTVYHADTFVHKEGAYPILEHEVTEDGDQSAADVRAVYAVEWTPGADGPTWQVMYRPEIDRRRARAPGNGKGGPWASDYAEMAKKTVGKQLLKGLPRRASALREAGEAPEAEAVATADVQAIAHEPTMPGDEVLEGVVETQREPAPAARQPGRTPAPKLADEPLPAEEPPLPNPDDSPFG